MSFNFLNFQNLKFQLFFFIFSSVVEEHEKEMTSSMMAAFMGVGLTVGSAISFVLIQFVS